LAWIAGKIQFEWFPGYTETLRNRWTRVRKDYNDAWTWVEEEVWHHDHVWAHVFGDVGKEVTGWGIDRAIKVATPKPSIGIKAVESAATADEASFKTRLENAMLQEASLTSNAIMSVAIGINANDNYGSECLQKLKRVNARARDPKVGEKELEFLAKQMIREDM